MLLIAIDCDAFVRLDTLNLTGVLESALVHHDARLITHHDIAYVELGRSSQRALDRVQRWEGAELLDVQVRPDKAQSLPKSWKKLVRKLFPFNRKKHKSTSDNDRGLLAVALMHGACLLTDEMPLRELAHKHGHPCVDLTQLIDALHRLGTLDRAEWERHLDMRRTDQSHRFPQPLNMDERLTDPNHPEYLDCIEPPPDP